jgi:hypothetical protein
VTRCQMWSELMSHALPNKPHYTKSAQRLSLRRLFIIDRVF